MKSKNFIVVILILCVYLSGCNSGQLFGATNTPSPTITNTLFPTSTLTLTPTTAFTPKPTATPIPIPECKSIVYSSADLKDFSLWQSGKGGGEHIIETDNGEPASKIIYSKDYASLGQEVLFELPGTYLITLDVKRENFYRFLISIQQLETANGIFERNLYPRDISDTEYTRVWGTFEIKRYVTLRVKIGATADAYGAQNLDNETIIVWVKNLKICRID